MTHQEHVALIREAITTKGGVWADLGSGEGAFTLALRDLAGFECCIYSVDKDEGRLRKQKQTFEQMFPRSRITYMLKDFTQKVELSKLDGILMANALHYVKEQNAFLRDVMGYLKPNGKLVLVEYNTLTASQ